MFHLEHSRFSFFHIPLFLSLSLPLFLYIYIFLFSRTLFHISQVTVVTKTPFFFAQRTLNRAITYLRVGTNVTVRSNQERVPQTRWSPSRFSDVHSHILRRLTSSLRFLYNHLSFESIYGNFLVVLAQNIGSSISCTIFCIPSNSLLDPTATILSTQYTVLR